MQIQPLTSIPCHYLPHPAAGRRKAFETETAGLVKSSQPHLSGQKFQPYTYPSPPMSNPPSPPRRYIATSSAADDHHSSHEPGRSAFAPPQSRAESSAAFRRAPIPSSISLPSQPHYQPLARSLLSPVGAIGPPPTLNQGTLLDSRYFPQRAAISHHGIGAGIVQSEIGRPAASLRGTRSSRRGKTHVQKACINCKKAHLSCDSQRPCARCVASGKQDTCQDVEHKKRGRPRLRDDRDSRPGRDIVAAEQGRSYGEAPILGTSFPSGHRRTQSGRILRSHRASVGSMVQPAQPDPRLTRHTITGAPAPPEPYSPRRGLEARVFLTLNFRIVKANQQFRDQFASGSDVAGRDLREFVDHRHERDLQHYESRLREEREALEPNLLPTIYSGEEQQAIEGINEAEIAAYTTGSSESSERWTFVQTGMVLVDRQMYIQLGKVRNFPFVVVTLAHYAASSLPAAVPSAYPPMIPAVPQIPLHFDPQYQRSPGSATGYPQTGSGPSTPSLSLQSLASSLPPTSNPLPAYGLSSSRYDQGGYFPAQPRTQPSQPSTQPSTQPPSATYDPLARFGHPPSLYSTSSRPTSTVSEPFGTATSSSASRSRPISYPGQPRTFETMQAESEGGARTPGEPESQAEDDDARKRRRLNIREITD